MKRTLIALALLGFVFPCSGYAAGLSDAYENKLIDHVFRGQTMSAIAPTQFYVALYTSPCTDSVRGNEVTGAGYSRVPVSRNLSSWQGTHGSITPSIGTTGVIRNTQAIVFNQPLANWGTVVAFGIEDAFTGGQMVVCGSMAAKTILYGNRAPALGVGSLVIGIE